MTAGPWRPQARAAALVLAVLTLLGAPAGLVWAALAPRLDLVLTASGLNLANPESEALIADDGYFLFIGAALGLLTGIAAYRATRPRPGVGAVVGLAAGGFTASTVAATVGERLYRPAFTSASHAATRIGTHLHLYVAVRAEPVLFAWSFAAVASYALAVLLFEPVAARPVSAS